MIKNLKLGVKMTLGFGFIILLVAIVGGLSIVNMSRITVLSERLKDAYIPEVRVANELERESLRTMRYFSEYSLSFDPDLYKEGMNNHSVVVGALDDALALSEQYSYLSSLKTEAEIASQNVDEYGRQIALLKNSVDAIEAAREQMDAAAAKLLDQAEEYLNGQASIQGEEFAASNVGESALLLRAWKSRTMNAVIDMVNSARVLNFKAQATKDYSYMKEAVDALDQTGTLVQSIRAETKRSSDINFLGEIEKSAKSYQEAVRAAYNGFLEVEKIRNDSTEAGNKVLEAAKATASAGVGATQDIANTTAASLLASMSLILIGVAVALILALIIAVLLTRSIVNGLKQGVAFAEEIALGNLEVQLDINQKDEIGILADALRSMLVALQEKGRVIERIAEGDLTVQFSKTSEKDGLGESLTIMKRSLTDILSNVKGAVEQVASGADQVSQASQELSQGATEQASSLEEITSSINEINAQAKQNAENAMEANGIAKSAVTTAGDGNREMTSLQDAMAAINKSSDQIKKVVKVIDDIAFQINLLALNANVEAARAGKYGKGFAVVAEEVRNLAVKSGGAVQETTMMVEESIGNIELGNKYVESTAGKLKDIVNGVEKVAHFLEEISVASREQAQGIDQITEGLDQIDQVTQSNTASAEESASASEELAGQADQLQSLIQRFRLEDRHLALDAPRSDVSFEDEDFDRL
jgi:methyl-accepting chemotaxis protein